MLTGDLEVVDSCNGHYDVVYGTYDPKYLTRYAVRRDCLFHESSYNSQMVVDKELAPVTIIYTIRIELTTVAFCVSFLLLNYF